MRYSYRWTEDENDIASDAITVRITSATRILTISGLQFGQRDATIYWPDWLVKRELLKAASEGPMPVEKALAKAKVLCSQHAFARVVICVQHRELWDARWGTLALEPGL